jgi:hypothetical protein
MPLRPFIVLFALLAAVYCPPAGAAPEGQNGAGQPSSTGPVVAATRQNAFTIPFRIEPTQNPSEQPIEVQLHVSTNQGATWELSSRAKPEKGSFVFRAPHDGEYWYAIRTVDKQGVTRPDGLLQPQLKVIVDTVAPRLDLTARRGEGGEIEARWQAVDPHLKLGSFTLEFQTDPAGPWERVAVEAPPSAMRYTLSGKATWWPRTAGGPINVRAEITDQAGNPAVSQAVVKTGDSFGEASAARSTPADPAMQDDRGGPSDSTRWPADRSTNEPLGRAGGDAAAASDGNWRGAGSRDGGRSTGQRVPARPVGQSYRGGRPGSALDFSVLPPGERPRMVNSRSFELEYEIESVGPSGIGKVELWATRDGGRSWSPAGVDPDNRNPMPVTVDGEGIYGFRIVVQSGSGLGGQPPAAGDMPDVWIGVDLTNPTGRITAAEVSAAANDLMIRWEASDDVLATRPISLAFSNARGGGAWTPIASGLENSGSYQWRLDNRLPDPIYLRLEVRDEAGNVGTFDWPEPVSLDRNRPEGHIRGVRPSGQQEGGH